MIKKIESFFPIFACLPTWLQIVVLIWVSIGIIIFSAVTVFYYNEKKEIINIVPNSSQVIVPSLDDQKSTTIIIGLSIWTKKNYSLEICLITTEIFNEKEQKYLTYGTKITDKMNRPLDMPLLLKDMKKEDILIHIPILNKDDIQIKARINFIPYDIRNKVNTEIFISRGLNEYQAALFYGKHHIEFGKVSAQGGQNRNIKFLKKYNKPPEISISP